MAYQVVWQIIIMIVAAIVSYAMRPKPQAPEAARLEDFDVPTAEEGRRIPVIFGTVWMSSPNVVWYGDLQTQAIKKKSGK